MAKDMTSGKLLKLIWNFTIPLLIGNLFQQLYNMAYTFIVGRMIACMLAAAGSIVLSLIIGVCNRIDSWSAPVSATVWRQGLHVKHSFMSLF